MKMSGIYCCTVFILLSFGFFECVAKTTNSDKNKTNSVVEDDASDDELLDDSYDTGAANKNSKLKEKNKIFLNKISGVIKPGVVKEIEVNSVNFIKLQERADEVFIPDPNIVDVQMLSDNSLYLIALAPGTTTLVINGKRGNILLDCKIRVTYPLQAIRDAIKEMHPDTDVEILSLDKSVILKGRVPSPEAAADIVEIASKFIDSDNIVNKLTIETATQVLLKVKIAEVSRTVSKSLGIHWRAISFPNSNNGMAYGFATGNAALIASAVANGTESSTGVASMPVDTGNSSAGTTTTTTPNASGATAGSTSTTATAAAGGGAAVSAGGLSGLASDAGPLNNTNGGRWMIYNGGQHSLGGILDALASENLASILAEPTLVAMSGNKAEFKSGGEYGYRVVQPGESAAATTEYKNWGTSVEFTPVVISEDRINITVTPKVSSLKPVEKDQPPSLESKEATTTIELGSGQSFAIAGLLQTNITSASDETPFLADLPLLGPLFRSSSVVKEQRELVIIVTPYIVKPSSKPLKAPTDMVPRLLSPVESILSRKFYQNARKHKKSCACYRKGRRKGCTNGFSLK